MVPITTIFVSKAELRSANLYWETLRVCLDKNDLGETAANTGILGPDPSILLKTLAFFI